MESSERAINVDYTEITRIVRPKETIYIDDGAISLQVLEVGDYEIKCLVKDDGILKGRKSMRVGGGGNSSLEAIPCLTRTDENDLINIALAENFDFVTASLSYRSKDLKYIRDVLGPKGAGIHVLVKIDNLDALHNFKDLIQTADGAIFCREDLNTEISSEKLVYAQKWLCEVAAHYGKPMFVHG
jgi:pyruvate kinase